MFEIEVSEMDDISNEIKFLLPFTFARITITFVRKKSYICLHNIITFALIFSRYIQVNQGKFR